MRRPIALCLALLSACRAEPQGSEPPAAAASVKVVSSVEVPRLHPACSEGMAHVEGFCIDRYEAHLVDARAPEVVLSPFERPGSATGYMARSHAGVTPQGYLNRIEAAKACRTAGKRLCRAREWYRACASGRSLRYPYGNDEQKGRCNTRKPHVMEKVFGTAVRFTFADHYNSPRLNRDGGFLAKSGEHVGCESEDGLFDMVGNLHEWVADNVSTKLRRQIPLEYAVDQLGAPGNGAFMGGYYSSKGEHGVGCAYVTTSHRPDYHDYSIGFRCCTDAANHPADHTE